MTKGADSGEAGFAPGPRLMRAAAWVLRPLIGKLYRIRVLGLERLPGRGAVLLVCNHLSYVDAVILQCACPRPLRFLGDARVGARGFSALAYGAAGTIALTEGRPLAGLRRAAAALARGEVVCLFPEGAISRTGQLMRLQRGYAVLARRSGAPVVPVALDGLWGSVFSFSANRYLWKSPRLMPTAVTVAFGAPIPAVRADLQRVREALLDLGAAAFAERPTLGRHLGREAVRVLARHPGRLVAVDRVPVRRETRAAVVLAAAAVLARRLRRTTPERRVGVILPPGTGGLIANLAVVCAGKVPVNLNFTAGRGQAEAALRVAGVSTVITAQAMKERLGAFPWPVRTLDLRTELEEEGGRRALLPWLAAAWLLPNAWVANRLGLPRLCAPDEEAALLFSSGSAGDPKGVVLTHRNILANAEQISSLAILPESASILACMPLFHGFGLTVTVWYPLLRGCRIVAVPNPLDTTAVVDAIRQERASVLIGAPTFVRPLLKKARPADLRSLDLLVTGAEKLPEEVRKGFLESFHIPIFQGYGLTETSPVACVNQPDPVRPTDEAPVQAGHRRGTVGRLLPGMTLRVVDPETGEPLGFGAVGLILLRGANVFSGYLGSVDGRADQGRGKGRGEGAGAGDGTDGGVSEVRGVGAGEDGGPFRAGWFVTGDLGSVDEDGFLRIEGRLARFSKVGGEMVPHAHVEQTVAEVFGIDQDLGPRVVVIGAPNAARGEILVLLVVANLGLEEVRDKLMEAGLPNLWVPRAVRRVEAIPLLGSGKLDLEACRRLALEAV